MFPYEVFLMIWCNLCKTFWFFIQIYTLLNVYGTQSPRGRVLWEIKTLKICHGGENFLSWTGTSKSFHTSSLNLWLIQEVFDDGWTGCFIIWKITLLETFSGLTILTEMFKHACLNQKISMSDFYQPERTVVLPKDWPFNRSFR